jgi:hypothetical protein
MRTTNVLHCTPDSDIGRLDVRSTAGTFQHCGREREENVVYTSPTRSDDGATIYAFALWRNESETARGLHAQYGKVTANFRGAAPIHARACLYQSGFHGAGVHAFQIDAGFGKPVDSEVVHPAG